MFYIAHISLAMIIIMFIVVARQPRKNQLSKLLMFFMFDLFLWTISVLAINYSFLLGLPQYILFFENLTYFGVAFTAVHMLQISLLFSNESPFRFLKSKYMYVIPIVTQVMVWTNGLHHAFYHRFDFFDINTTVFGWYFYIHTGFSYFCLLIALVSIAKVMFKNRGVSKNQAFIIFVGTLIPILVNVFFTLNVEGFSPLSTPVAFLVTMLAYFFGVVRYNLFRVTPMAMKMVINKMSEMYLVVDERLVILDYNEQFYNTFSPLINLKKQISITDAMSSVNKTGVTAKSIGASIKECRDTLNTVYKDYEISKEGKVSYFSAEYSALIIDNKYYGCILLLRDVTQARKDMEEIKRNQNIIVERERLASIGQLIGGIAHNLKTPIMAIAGRAVNLEALFDEYEQSLDDETVTKNDHKEIIKDMRNEIDTIQEHISYISEIITTVKDQTVKLNDSINYSFTIDELIKRVKILMQHELTRNNCELTVDMQADEETTIEGDLNSMIQIIDNIISNAIYAYNGAHGKIDMTITRNEQHVVFAISDEAGGIPEEVQQILFREMTTTKGKDGTGLGLYMSHANIAGRFGGKMWFNSVEGKGTEFFISVPISN